MLTKRQIERDIKNRKMQMIPKYKREVCRLVRSYQNLTGILLPIQITDNYVQLESLIQHMSLKLHNARVEASLGW